MKGSLLQLVLSEAFSDGGQGPQPIAQLHDPAPSELTERVMHVAGPHADYPDHANAKLFRGEITIEVPEHHPAVHAGLDPGVEVQRQVGVVLAA